MFEILFLIGAWITITPPPALISDSTSVLICEFSRDDIGPDFLLINKYQIQEYSYELENPKTIPVISIHRIYELDDLQPQGTSLIAIVIPKANYRTNYFIKINHAMPKDSDWFYYSGYYPNLEDNPPDIFIRK